jgi:hypothetical protein
MAEVSRAQSTQIPQQNNFEDQDVENAFTDTRHPVEVPGLQTRLEPTGDEAIWNIAVHLTPPDWPDITSWGSRLANIRSSYPSGGINHCTAKCAP